MEIKTAREMLAAATPGPWWNESGVIHAPLPNGGAHHPLEVHENPYFLGDPEATGDLAAGAPATLAALILAVEALKDRCWHRELYEERSDGASDIYPSIMHEDKCSDETECEPCGACKALAAWEKL